MAELRRCIGSARFGIEPHEAPPTDFPAQPSQKDGLGRMCKIHWNQYTTGLARDAKARKAADGASVAAEPGQTPIAPGRPTAKKARATKPAPSQPRVRASRRTTGEPTAEQAPAAS